jgi:hypothetical protein
VRVEEVLRNLGSQRHQYIDHWSILARRPDQGTAETRFGLTAVLDIGLRSSSPKVAEKPETKCEGQEVRSRPRKHKQRERFEG